MSRRWQTLSSTEKLSGPGLKRSCASERPARRRCSSSGMRARAAMLSAGVMGRLLLLSRLHGLHGLHGLHAPLHLLGGDVFHVGGDVPAMAEGIDDAAQAV